MEQLLWLTDLHLNFVSFDQVADFLDTVNQHPAQIVVISGDLTEAPQLPIIFKMLNRFVEKPVYFVCGNHDYYHSSVWEVRESIPAWLEELPNLTWLNNAGIVELSPYTALIGHDGWADGRYGNYQTSPMMLNDFMLIEELREPISQARLLAISALGYQAAQHFYQWLPQALEQYEQVIIVTHVPPFAESSLKDGQPNDDVGLPFYANRAAGEALLDIAAQYPDKQIIVLCGHTHSASDLQILPNLRVIVGQAEYRQPEIQSLVLTVP